MVALDSIFYIAVFASIYVQVFFFVTFLENRKNIIIRKVKTVLPDYPAVTIIVPALNEEKTIQKSIKSLLNLNYPKDKLEFILIDDGSKDDTFGAFKKFKHLNNVKIFRQEINQGKHAALNLGLEHTTTEYVGCLDADSTVDSEALARIMSYFLNDPVLMAVAPAVTVNDPKGLIQNAQRVEYGMGIYFKKMLGFLGAINVTPGPFTIFKKKVFDDLGPYAYAYHTEDMEIAYRMQKNHYKIDNCIDAYVYTNAPYTIPKLFKQRLRWIYGFINNTIDYRHVLFRKKYGNFSLFTLPMGVISIFSVSYVFCRMIYNLFNFITSKITEYKVIGFPSWGGNTSFDPFFINFKISIVVTMLAYTMVLFAILMGRQMIKSSKETWGFPYQIIYYLIIFSILTPLWVAKAAYNTLISKAPTWR